MIKKVKLVDSDDTFYVKLSVNFTFGIPSENWIGIDNGKIYHSDDLVFFRDV